MLFLLVEIYFCWGVNVMVLCCCSRLLDVEINGRGILLKCILYYKVLMNYILVMVKAEIGGWAYKELLRLLLSTMFVGSF